MDVLDLFLCFSLDITFATLIYGFHDKDKLETNIQKKIHLYF